ncbi:MAG: HAMP domain-containing histidine kinase [Clostridiales Family XIII bacterium]|jgi:signal transduction histidine kinase|nr:HAMP domain-containing histidine kinase [Clostridiales Family XIII bacterium]
MKFHHRAKHTKDQRITAGTVSLKQFFVIFLTVLFICANYHIIYITYWETEPGKQDSLPGVMFGLVLLVSLVGTFLIGLLKNIYFDKPILTISDAAQKVSNGDFSIRIPAHRKDGKKDYVEVLIEDFNKMTEELSTIETLKTDFIANVSHEIKTPLSVIQSYATFIQDDCISADERHEYGETIVAASKKLTELVTNILKLNKLENQEIQQISEPYALDEQLRECVLNYEELWEKKNITLVGDDISRVTVNYDRTLLELVWNNLISNAIKFTGEGGSITLTLKSENGYSIVSIHDTGCGMSEETVLHVFDRFYQGDSSHSFEGNGLGLALAQKVITLIDGEIDIDSCLDVGTTITVKLKDKSRRI